MVFEECALANKIIGWLSNVEPKFIPQRQTVQRSFCSHLREDLLFDHAEPLRDAIEDGNIKEINAGVNLITNEVRRFLHEGLHLPFAADNHNPESAGIIGMCERDGSLCPMALMVFE